MCQTREAPALLCAEHSLLLLYLPPTLQRYLLSPTPVQCRAGDPVPPVSPPRAQVREGQRWPRTHILTLGPFSCSLISLHKIPSHPIYFYFANKEREELKKKKNKTELNCFSSTSRIIVFVVCLGRRSPLIFCPGLGNLLYVAPRLPSSAHPGNPSS